MIRIKNWQKFQHFKDRDPPWIKLYRDLLDDPDWHDLPGDDAKALIMLWLMADKEGTLPSCRKIAFRLRITEAKLNQLLNKLSHWLEQDDINTISDRYQVDAPETETETYREETETEILSVSKTKPTRSRKEYSEDFEKLFWLPYPRTAVMSKKEAASAWRRLSDDDQKAAIAAVVAYRAFLAERPDHPAVHACRFLSQRRFDGFAAPEPKSQSEGGWRPGLPTDAELRAKYASVRPEAETIRGHTESDSSVVQDCSGPRSDEQKLVQNQDRRFQNGSGAKSLEGVLRETGLVSEVLQNSEKGSRDNASLPMAGMAPSDREIGN